MEPIGKEMKFDEWAAKEYGVPVSTIDPDVYKGLKACWTAAQKEGMQDWFALGKESALHDIAQHIDKLIGEMN
jgi:hypothetical protein